MIADLKQKNISMVLNSERVTGTDLRSANIIIHEITHLDNYSQAEKIADHFSAIPNEYEPIKEDDIDVPPFSQDDIPQFHPTQVWFELAKIKITKALFLVTFLQN